MSILYLIGLIPLALIGGIVGLVFSAKYYRRIPSPEKSEKALTGLKKEADKWLTEGLISQEQSERIISRYQLSSPVRSAQKKGRLVKILAFFGSVLVGIGVILLIAANWREIPDFVYTALLVVLTGAVYFLAWRLKYQKTNHPKIGDGLIILGSLLFGASLILIGQIYHIRIEFSHYLLIWALAVLPLAYFEKSLAIFILSNVLVVVWAFFSLEGAAVEQGDFSWQYYAALLFVLAIVLPLAYKLNSRTLLSLGVVEVLVWLGPFVSLKWFQNTASPVVDSTLFFLACGIVLFAIGAAHSKAIERFKHFKAVFYPIGAVVAMLSSFILSFPQIYEVGNNYFAFRQGASPEVGAYGSFMPVLFNFVLLAEIIAIIYLGIKQEEDSFVNTGIVFFGLLVVARYFSLAWGLSSRAIVFIVGGILLIVGGYFLDKLRKRFLRQIEEQQRSSPKSESAPANALPQEKPQKTNYGNENF